MKNATDRPSAELVGLENLDYSKNDKILLKTKTEFPLEDKSHSCYYHEKKYLVQYESLQRQCVDPTRCPSTKVTSNYCLNVVQ